MPELLSPDLTRGLRDVLDAYEAINARRGALRDVPAGINSRGDLVVTAANLLRTIDAIDRREKADV